MWLKLSTFALLPVLVIQGVKVRKNTPRLLEASGDRDGLIGQGQPLSLLILGDSAAAGVGVETQQDALSGAIISELKKNICCTGNCMQKLVIQQNKFIKRSSN
jgi:hypothetical protein